MKKPSFFNVLRASALILFCCLVLTLACVSYGQVTSGAFRGHVIDATGASVANAVVSSTNEATGVTQGAMSDADGGYVLGHLTPGRTRLPFARRDSRPFRSPARN